MADAPRHAGPAVVVAAGVAAAAITAVTSARPWFHLALPQRARVGIAEDALRADMPLALALALVVLAAWGAVLVTRGRTRRVVLVVGLLAALGVLACAVAAPFVLPDQIRDGLPDARHEAADPTVAYLVVCVVAVASVAALVVAWVQVPRWPTMSSRYDAPAARSVGPHETDLWKALDEGRDPTEAEGPPSP
jgi:hypothetical protein